MRNKETERLTFDAPKSIAQNIRKRAQNEGVSLADIIRALLRKALSGEN